MAVEDDDEEEDEDEDEDDDDKSEETRRDERTLISSERWDGNISGGDSTSPQTWTERPE